MADIRSIFVPFDLDSGGGTELILGVNIRRTDAGGSTEALGSSLSALSVPVVIASDQGAIDVSGATVTVDSELPAAALLADNTANPTVPAVGAFGMVFDGITWDRAPGTSVDGTLVNLGANNDVSITGSVDTELPAAALLADNSSTPTAPAVGAFSMVFDGTTWDQMRGTSVDGVLVNLGANNDITIAGSVDTELPAAAALTDDFANPTAPAVGAFGMVWDGATWDRAPGTSADGVLVNLGTNNDVVTAASVPTNPVVDSQSSVAVAAGVSVNIDSLEAPSKKLRCVDVWASVAFKAELHTVDNAVESARLAIFGGDAMQAVQYVTAHKDYFQTTTTAGADNFRIDFTNLDDNQPADAHVVFHYED